MKKKEKEEKEKGESDLYNAHFCWSLYINVTFHDPLRGKLAAGEKYKIWGKNKKGETILLF